MLVTQLQAEEQLVAENALSVLTEAAESPVYLKVRLMAYLRIRTFNSTLHAVDVVHIALRLS